MKMAKQKLSMLDVFQEFSSQLKSTPTTKEYHKKEKEILKKRMASSKEDADSITMSSHKFSL